MVSPAILVDSPHGRLRLLDRRLSTRSVFESPSDYLGLIHGWVRVPLLAKAIDTLDAEDSGIGLRPLSLKRSLREVHAAALAKQQNGGMLEVDRFLRGPCRSWDGIVDYGRELRDRHPLTYGLRSRQRDSNEYLFSLGQLLVLSPLLRAPLALKHAAIYPTFCDVCWRVTLTNQKYCPVHTVKMAEHASPLSPTNDSYWFARRLKSEYEQQLKHLRKRDVLRKTRSKWQRALKAHDESLAWLAAHRPLLYAHSAVWLMRYPERPFLPRLVATLDQIDRESPVQRAVRSCFHEMIGVVEHEREIYEMAQRAEAWFSAAQERRSSWGGARHGAGRKPRAYEASRD